MSEPRLYLRGRVWWTWYQLDGKTYRISTKCRDRDAATSVAIALERAAYGAVEPDEVRWFQGPYESFVYFIQQGEDGPIKIGRASRVGVRMSRIQTGSHVKLRLRCAMPGGARLEWALHRTFVESRLEGEWFKPTHGLLELVAEIEKTWGSSDL